MAVDMHRKIEKKSQRELQVSIEELRTLHPVDIAAHLEDLPIDEIRRVLRELPNEISAEVIVDFPMDVQVALFEAMRVTRLSGIVGEMFSDDLADLMVQLSPERLQSIMKTLEPEQARRIVDLMEYPEDSAGGIMQGEFLAVNQNMTMKEATELLRHEEDLTTKGLFYVYVVDDRQRLQGVLRIRDLLFQHPEKTVQEVMVQEVRAVSVHADQEEIAIIFRDYGLSSIPVVDDFQRLRGIVTVDDVMHVMEEEATEDMQRMVGVSGQEMIDTPWKRSVKNRLPWLCVNLLTAFAAGFVVSLFEGTITRYAVLAIFLPIIAGLGGNTGTQTLTIMVRSLALGEFNKGMGFSVLRKQLIVGLVNGLAIGLVVGGVAYFWKGEWILGMVAFLAMLLNIIIASIIGVLIPLGLKSLKIDPALASGIMLTATTDIIGFLVFLGLAVIGMHYFPL